MLAGPRRRKPRGCKGLRALWEGCLTRVSRALDSFDYPLCCGLRGIDYNILVLGVKKLASPLKSDLPGHLGPFAVLAVVLARRDVDTDDILMYITRIGCPGQWS